MWSLVAGRWSLGWLLVAGACDDYDRASELHDGTTGTTGDEISPTDGNAVRVGCVGCRSLLSLADTGRTNSRHPLDPTTLPYLPLLTLTDVLERTSSC